MSNMFIDLRVGTLRALVETCLSWKPKIYSNITL